MTPIPTHSPEDLGDQATDAVFLLTSSSVRRARAVHAGVLLGKRLTPGVRIELDSVEDLERVVGRLEDVEFSTTGAFDTPFRRALGRWHQLPVELTAPLPAMHAAPVDAAVTS